MVDHSRSGPALRSALFLAALVLALLTPACSTLVGDACELNADCGGTMICERSLPEGYCTRPDCERNGCPADGVCIYFDEGAAYCMKPCDSNADCREGYACVTDFGAYPFCNDADG